MKKRQKCRFFFQGEKILKKFSIWPKKKPIEEGIDGYDWREDQPKWPVARVMNTVLAVGSVIVWVLILFRIFSSGNADFEKMILLNEKAAAIYPGKTAEVLRIHPSTSEEEDGGVILSYPIYLEEAENLQFTARINRRTLPPKGKVPGYTFILRETGGEETRFYSLSYYESEKKFQYEFFRLCFEGIELDENKVYTFLVYEGEVLPEEGAFSPKDADFIFTVFNSDTYANKITPKRHVFRIAK
jgi:hypothetical protein